ncbi:MAG: hypothetical protein SNF33_07245 [Candidatus Algichlamydia australiensis]|nr:hypothetical protein [Chlamydiales bacterium]
MKKKITVAVLSVPFLFVPLAADSVPSEKSMVENFWELIGLQTESSKKEVGLLIQEIAELRQKNEKLRMRDEWLRNRLKGFEEGSCEALKENRSLKTRCGELEMINADLINQLHKQDLELNKLNFIGCEIGSSSVEDMTDEELERECKELSKRRRALIGKHKEIWIRHRDISNELFLRECEDMDLQEEREGMKEQIKKLEKKIAKNKAVYDTQEALFKGEIESLQSKLQEEETQ